MATAEAVRGASITELEDAPSPPTHIFDIGSIKVNITSTTLEQPVSSPPLQRNGSAAIKTRKSIVSSLVERSEGRQVWPEPEKSIGTACCQVGKSKLQCWEAKGPALELTQNLVSDVRKHLDCKTDYIYGRKSVRPPLILGIYMVGKSIGDARPFLVVSCSQDEPREKAIKLIKRSKILNQFEENGGVRLREQRRPPISLGPVTLASGISTQEMATRDAAKVFYNPQQGAVGSSIQLYIQIFNKHGMLCRHKATLGCFLWFRGRYLAFTAAHPFLDLPLSPDSDGESELDFPFEDESEISSFESDEDDAGRTREASFPSTHAKEKRHEGAAHTSEPEVFDETWDASNQLEEFGFLFASSIERGNEASLDWALIEITQPRLDSDTIALMNGSPNFVVLHHKPLETKVFAKTASNGTRYGDLSPMPTFMLLPGSPNFQEIWTVRFDGNLENGDCGTLVVDSGGNIYGHLVAGDLENSIGYIVPATQTFENMKQQIGDGLSTIRPSLTALDALMPPTSSEPNETRLSTTQPQLSNHGGLSFLKAWPSSFRTSSKAGAANRVTLSQPVSSNKAAPTVPSAPGIWDGIEFASPSDAHIPHLEERKDSRKTPRHETQSSSRRVASTNSSIPRERIGFASPSDAHIPHLEERKYSKKTQRHETQSSSRRGPSRRELAGRRRNPLRNVNHWRWDPMARAGYDPPPGIFFNAHMQQSVLEIMESDPFQWKIVITAGSGVFAASYAFFVPYMILPALNFVYWPNATSLDKNYKVHLVALAGALLGSLLAGIIADIFGRKQLYRLGPFLLVIGAIGLAGASAGFSNSTMSILGWILFWQFLLGIGVGVEWTLSGVISAEFAPAAHRSKMMATIFLMQPIAYLIVSALVLVLLVSLERSSGLREEIDHQRAAIAVDKLWRYLVGLGGIPALITLFFRAGMYESPRYLFDLAEEEGPVDEARWHFMVESDIRLVSYFTASQFLRDLGNWRHLAGISICAFILNAANGSLGGDNYRVLAQTWAFSAPQTNTTSLYAWNDVQSGSASIGEAIYKVIFDMSLHSIYTMSIVSVLGSLILIILVEHCPRRKLLMYPSLALAIVFTILATVVQTTTSRTPVPEIAMTILCYGIFNIGPNLILFVMPTELFPTSYRATCFALVYSSGKIGSILVQSIPAVLYSSNQHGRVYFLFSMMGCLLAISLFSRIWLPTYGTSSIFHRRFGFARYGFLNLEDQLEEVTEPEKMAPGFGGMFKGFRRGFNRELPSLNYSTVAPE